MREKRPLHHGLLGGANHSILVRAGRLCAQLPDALLDSLRLFSFVLERADRVASVRRCFCIARMRVASQILRMSR